MKKKSMSSQAKETLEQIAKEYFCTCKKYPCYHFPHPKTEVKWIHAPERVVQSPTRHIHMIWLLICIISTAIGYVMGKP